MLADQSLNSDNELTLFLHDALRFISAFIIPISQRVAHVYLSALPFTPEQSLVARKFCPRVPNTLAITEGKLSQWPMVVFTAEHHKNRVWHVVFSPDESTFASISLDAMYVCDSETGHCISGPFQLPSYVVECDACFDPDGKHILVKFDSYAVIWNIKMGEEQFRIEGSDFAFTHHDRRIASTHRNADENSKNPKDKDSSRLLVKLWDAGNGALISNRLLEVNGVAVTRFSPDGHFLAVGRKSEDVIALWNLEDGKNLRQFPYPHGQLSSLIFSPTSDSLIAISGGKPRHIYLWRLDTQEMVSFSYDFNRYLANELHVIHSPLTNYLYIYRNLTVEIWDVSVTGSKMVWETKSPATSYASSIYPSRDSHRLLVGHYDGSVRLWDLDLEDLARTQADTKDTQDDTDT